jgi:O-antigen/teichoic acid export membrane protein
MSFGALAGTAASLAVTGVVGAVLSPAAVGSLRGASTFIGPLNVMMAFVSLGMTPVLVRRARSRDLRFCLAVAGTVLSVVCAWAAVVLLLPDAWGRAVLGDSWAGARSVLPWTLLEYAALGVASASTLGLKVRQEARMLVRQKAVVSVLVAVLGCGAALLLHDVRAVSAGLAVAGLVSVTLGWRHLTESMRRSADGAVDERVSERPPDQPLVSGTP